MADQQIKDRGGRLVGIIKTLPNGRQEIRDPSGRSLGTYDPKTNKTKDSTGRLVATGNVLTALLRAF